LPSRQRAGPCDDLTAEHLQLDQVLAASTPSVTLVRPTSRANPMIAAMPRFGRPPRKDSMQPEHGFVAAEPGDGVAGAHVRLQPSFLDRGHPEGTDLE
jgi:hypothetical protein